MDACIIVCACRHWKNKILNECIHVCMADWMNDTNSNEMEWNGMKWKRMNEWVNKEVNGWMNEWRVSEGMHEWMN